ncbi:FAD-dependent thymidylate synthase [Salinimonas marina]|uniref:FAD-dependent thymidylate synthase n=1 Tax=Salinimonas marina TaxID=2785918 RepID=A0A7S9DZT4_9ALTE|nr:FAD-dependent thymidylate synthase [Salinimonas marina]QPG06930.1 FAD-dependent thymidylate synthase [Salinimonas marina]
MKAEYIPQTSADLMTVNAARVSMDKESTEFTYRKDKPKGSDEGLVSYLATHRHWTPFSHVRFTLASDFVFVDLENINPEDVASAAWRTDKNKGIFKFRTSLYGWAHLIKNDLIKEAFRLDVIHFIYKVAPECAKALLPYAPVRDKPHHLWQVTDETDPAFIDVTMRETVPIFVARQRFKHMIGTTYNEVSRRYVDDTPDFYDIAEWRSRPDGSIKQGSGGVHPDNEDMCGYTTTFHNDFRELYGETIQEGFAPEQVRSLLPQSMLTSYYVTASLNAWNRAYQQRIDSHAQKEIQDLAVEWDNIMLASEHSAIWKSISS